MENKSGWKVKFFCNIMGWHTVKKETPRRFDGVSYHSICSRCGKGVTRDSQGNWF